MSEPVVGFCKKLILCYAVSEKRVIILTKNRIVMNLIVLNAKIINEC